MTRCPNCGLPRLSLHAVMAALLGELGCHTNAERDICTCPKNQATPRFVAGNSLTKSRAETKGGRWPKIYALHNEPLRRDCRTGKYRYAVGTRGDVVVEAFGDYYNINNEFMEGK